MTAIKAPLFPLFMDLSGKRILIVGGGPVAARKCRAVLESGANVTVVSPNITAVFETWQKNGQISLFRRRYQQGEAGAYFLVFAATDSQAVNQQVYVDAANAGRLVNVVNDRSIGNCIVPSVVRRGDLAIAVTSSGTSPSLARLLRLQLEDQFGPEYEDLLVRLQTLRVRLQREGASSEEVAKVTARLFKTNLLHLLRQQRYTEADALIQQLTAKQEE